MEFFAIVDSSAVKKYQLKYLYLYEYLLYFLTILVQWFRFLLSYVLKILYNLNSLFSFLRKNFDKNNNFLMNYFLYFKYSRNIYEIQGNYNEQFFKKI